MLASASLVSLPLPPSTRHALLAAGLSVTADLRALSQEGLAHATGLSQDQAASVLQLSLGQPGPGWRLAGAVSAAELLSTDRSGTAAAAAAGSSSSSGHSRRISTGCRRLDDLLGGGGVARSTVTEFFGVPGVGKTQVGMQLAVNAQLPQALGGTGGRVLYIDTEGSFMTDRLIDMATAAVQRVQQQAAAAAAIPQPGQQPQQQLHHSGQQTTAAAAAAAAFSVESILSNILYFRVQHQSEQLALTRVLGTLLAAQPEVVLVVIDSVTFHFRQDLRDAAQRSRLMTGMAAQLAAAAEQHNVAVAMMNQVVTRIAEQQGRSSTGCLSAGAGRGSSTASAAWLAPALGEGWGQAAACRVALFWEGSQRLALLVKAKDVPQQQQQQQQLLCVPYQVASTGVSD